MTPLLIPALLVVALLLAPHPGIAQVESRNLVMIDPVQFISLYNISYHRALSPSMTVGGSVHGGPSFLSDVTGLSDVGVVAEGHYYLGGAAFQGFHAGVVFSFDNLRIELPEMVYDSASDTYRETGGTEVQKYTPFSAGLRFGWMWRSSGGLTLDVAAGADLVTGSRDPNPDGHGAMFSSIGMDDIAFLLSRNGIWPAGSVRIGYQW